MARGGRYIEELKLVFLDADTVGEHQQVAAWEST